MKTLFLLAALLTQTDGGVKGAQTIDVNTCARKIDLCFSPGECDALLVRQIAVAKRIDLAVYSLTRASLVDALRKAAFRGAVIRIYVDDIQAAGAAMTVAVRFLQTAGIPIRQDNSGGLMHLKVAAFDGSIVAYGSFNWTASAVQKNDEILTVWRCPTLAAAFLVQFEKLWAEGREFADGGTAP